MSLRNYLEGVRECVLQGWTQYTYAIDENGSACTIHDPKAACFCLGGAMRRMRDNGDDVKYYDACFVILYLIRPCDISGYNDTHDKAEVIEMLDRAIAGCP